MSNQVANNSPPMTQHKKKLHVLLSNCIIWQSLQRAKRSIIGGIARGDRNNPNEHMAIRPTVSAPPRSTLKMEDEDNEKTVEKWSIIFRDDDNNDSQSMIGKRKYAMDSNEDKEEIAVFARVSHINSALKSVGLL